MEDDALVPYLSRDLEDERPVWASSGRARHGRRHSGGRALESSTSAKGERPPSATLRTAGDEVLALLVARDQVQALSILMDRHLKALRVCAQEILTTRSFRRT